MAPLEPAKLPLAAKMVLVAQPPNDDIKYIRDVLSQPAVRSIGEATLS